MPLTYTDEQRRAYLQLTDHVGANWVTLFGGDTEFYSAVYWDILSHLWRNSEAVRKTDLIRAIHGIKSPLTATKYIDEAIKRGLILARDNPKDARSKLMALTPQMRAQLDTFFDDAVDAMCKAAKDVGR